MKKAVSGIAAALIVFSACTATTMAAGGRHCGWSGGNHCTGFQQGSGRYFIDANGDGLCDHCGGLPQGGGRYFVDANGDGLCDHGGSAFGQGGFHHGVRGGWSR